MSDTVVVIVSAFFVIGIIVGLIAVVAISVLRVGRRGDRGDPGGPLHYESPRPGAPFPDSRDDTRPDDHPRWPGGVGNDFSGG